MTKTIEFTICGEYADEKLPFEVCFDYDDVADYLVQRLKDQFVTNYKKTHDHWNMAEINAAMKRVFTEVYLLGAKKMAELMLQDYDLDDLFDDDEDFDEFLRERFEDDFREALNDGAYDRE